MSVINTNVKSMLAQNALTTNNRSMTNAMEQLSTGFRINSAKDDAAGLAISQNMTAQIRGLDQAVRNANDSIGLLQTAEGAMIEQSNMLHRMRELAIQAANDTVSPEQKGYLNKEFDLLRQEINRVGNNTQWNGELVIAGGSPLATGSLQQTATTQDQTIQFQLELNAATAAGDTVFVEVDGIRYTARYDATAGEWDSFRNPAGIVATNPEQLQITLVSGGAGQPSSITVTKNNGSFNFGPIGGTGNLSNLSTASVLPESVSKTLEVPFPDLSQAKNGDTISLRVGEVTYTAVFDGNLNTAAQAIGTVAASGAAATDSRTINLAGTNVVEGALYSITVGNDTVTVSAVAGDSLSNIAKRLAASAAAKPSFTASATGGVITISGKDAVTATITATATQQPIGWGEFFDLRPTPTQKPEENAVPFTIGFKDGNPATNTIVLTRDKDAGPAGDDSGEGNKYVPLVVNDARTTVMTDRPGFGTEPPSYPSKFMFQVGANANQTIDVEIQRMTIDDAPNGRTGALNQGGANGLDVATILTTSEAQAVIQRLDSAMQTINEQRATIGAVINRLTHAIDNLTNISMNATASRSQVLDTDYAAATTELSRTQIIQQAATAMLAQANQQPSTILNLLQ